MKSQNVRLFDIVALGPYMLFLALKGELSATERLLLAVAGIGTIWYNAKNYKEIAAEGALEINENAQGGVRG